MSAGNYPKVGAQSNSSMETRLEIPKEYIRYIIGKRGKNIQNIMSKTNTEIVTTNEGKTYFFTGFLIMGKLHERYRAKLKIKQEVAKCQSREDGWVRFWSSFITDGKEDTFELQPSNFENYPSKLVLISHADKENHSTIDRYHLLLQEISRTLQCNDEHSRTSSIWCLFGKIYLNEPPSDRKYTLLEVKNHVISKRLFAPEEDKWSLRFFGGISNDTKFIVLDKWISSLSKKCVAYKRFEITFLTPSCKEFRLKIFMVIDSEHSTELETVYKNAKCPHEVYNVIKCSETSPYFYICGTTHKTGLFDIFHPSSDVDVRLIVEANNESFSEQMEEADILFDYVKANLQTTPTGEVHLTKEKCPENFDESFTRVSFRDTYLCTTEGLQIVAQLSSEEYSIYDPTYVKNGHLDIHLAIDDCHEMTSKELVDKVPKLLRYARQLSSKLSTYEEDGEPGSVPPEILARGPKAQTAYKEALKKGKVKNYRVPVVLVGQARSGKTSLLRSLNGENFNSEEDSTVGVKLQRSLSKPEGSEWDVQDGSKENMMHNHCLSIKIVERLLGNPAKHIQEDVDRHESDEYEEIDRSANSRQESDHTNHKSSANRSEEEPLQAQKTTKMGKKEDAETKKFANVDTQTRQVLQPTQLTDEVATYTANLLGKPDVKGEIEDYLFFDTMDFAGQPVYSATHPVFLPPKGIYLLTHSLKTDINDKAVAIVRSGAAEMKVDVNNPLTNLDHLKIWLSLIAANSTQKGCSPVFLVSTHADNFSEADAKQTSRKILEAVKEKDFLPGQNVECEIYPVDNTVSGKAGVRDPSIEKLKKHLRDKVKELPQCNEDIPVRWFLFEKELNRLVRKEGKKELSTEDVKSIAIQCGVDTSTDEPDTLLNYLHDLKVIIYFPEANAIIIDTQWLLDMLAKVITVQPIECHKGYEDQWRRLEHEGVVDIPFLNHLWKDLLNDDTSVESLITIMEKFSLVCKQKDGSLLVPAMLHNSDFDELWNEFTEKDNLLSPLMIKFESSHLPFGFFPRLLAKVDKMCNFEWERIGMSGNFARFYKKIDDDELSLILISDTTTIAVVLSVDDENENLCSTSNKNYNHQCEWIVQFLRKTLEEMIKSFSWMKTLKFNFCIRCPVCLASGSCKKHKKDDCLRDSCVHLIPEEELNKPKPRCEKNCNKRKNAIPTESYLRWFPRHGDKKPGGNTTLQLSTKSDTDEAFRSSLTSFDHEDNLCADIIPLFEEVNLCTITKTEATELGKKVADSFKLDKNSIGDVPESFRRRCQQVYMLLIRYKMIEVLEAFRSELPCGVTGPIQFQRNSLVKNMDPKKVTIFTRAFTVQATEWKSFAKDQVGLAVEDIEFLDKREKDPVLEILKEHCCDWTVHRLYNALVDSGARAIADQYL